jgi:transposase
MPTIDDFVSKIKESSSIGDICKVYGISRRTCSRWMSKMNLSFNGVKKEYDKKLSERQQSILVGCLLGDEFISKSKRSKNARLVVRHKLAHKEYVLFLKNEFLNFTECEIRTRKTKKPCRIDGKISHNNWDGKSFCFHSEFYTVSHPCFTEKFCEWYKNGKKTIPNNVVIDEVSLAHWYAQDGSISSRTITFSTQCFSKEEHLFLCNYLNKKYGFHAKPRKSGIIQLSVKDCKPFLEIAKKELDVIKCMRYKTKYVAPKKSSNWKPPRLSKDQAYVIRHEYNHGITMQKLSEKYGVSISTICRVVNHETKIYKPDVCIGGSAEVKVGYNYGN